jgi:hypothetical protein
MQAHELTAMRQWHALGRSVFAAFSFPFLFVIRSFQYRHIDAYEYVLVCWTHRAASESDRERLGVALVPKATIRCHPSQARVAHGARGARAAAAASAAAPY